MGCGSAFARVALHFADRDRRHVGCRKCSIAVVLCRTGYWWVRVIIWALMTWVGWGRVECLAVWSLKFWGSRGSRKTSVRAHLLISRPRRPHLRSAHQIPHYLLSTPLLLARAPYCMHNCLLYLSRTQTCLGQFFTPSRLPPSSFVRAPSASHNGAYCAFKGLCYGCAAHSRAYSTLQFLKTGPSLTLFQALCST